MTASAFSLSSLYPFDALTVMAGETVIGGLHGPTRHYFCPHCMSWLFTRPEGMTEFVNVRSTLLDNAASYRPFIEAYTSEKLAGVSTGAAHRFETFPAPAQFPALITEFSETQ